MKWKNKMYAVLCGAFFLIASCSMPDTVSARESASEEPENLYAQSAVLMDADSGRILFAKNGQEERAMASTTKIMTCILALENADLATRVSVSAEAAAQPEVKLGMREGQEFYLEDMLYSLMLESHNDAAVAVAEAVSGNVGDFAGLMNAKAKELGCMDTYFITPNGLDAQDTNGIHHTTAEDLARIMRYCIIDSEKKDEFLKITGTQTYTFSDCEGKGSYTCSNHNAFLHMMDGALSGKTGYTSDAGYCYVGALREGERTFIVALLACGWPNNKGYKWSDTRQLMNYGLENYYYREIGEKPEKLSVKVQGGASEGFPGRNPAQVEAVASTEIFPMLLKEDEEVIVEYDVPGQITAPVYAGQNLGKVTYLLNGEKLREYPVSAAFSVSERTFATCLSYVRREILL